jgi:gas vesicle protein
MKSKKSELALALLGGIAIGAALAFLNAPSSGKKTRKKLKKKMMQYGSLVEDIVAEGKTSWQKFKDSTLDDTTNLETYLDHLVTQGKSKWEDIKNEVETTAEDFEIFMDSILTKGKKSWDKMNATDSAYEKEAE